MGVDPQPTTPGEDAPPTSRPRRLGPLDRRILSLAVPALGALVAEPLFVLVDTAVVGHLDDGAVPLAGLSLASTILLTAVGMCVFLAYATTASVARRLGAGDTRGALTLGVDGMWLAAGLGVVLAVAVWWSAPWAAVALGADAATAPHAVSYLRWSAAGLPGMLVVLAATGALRGAQDTRTPLKVAVTGAVVNAVLCVLLVHPAGLGIAGSGLSTALAQLGMGAALAIVVGRAAREAGARLRPAASGVLGQVRAGVPLLVRTASLRLALLLTVTVAAGLGATQLAGHQVVMSMWNLAAYILDAVAIAAQALVGNRLGAGQVAEARAVQARVTRWGVGAGAVIGGLLAASAPWLPALFTPDPGVRSAVTAALLVCAVAMPLAGWVFVLDGVLIGAGDGRYLAWAGMVTLAVYAPLAGLVAWRAPHDAGGLVALWLAFAVVFMAARAAVNALRTRGTRWSAVDG